MKKLIALLCVVALILVLSASALAAPSPSGSGSWTSDEEEHKEHHEGNDNNTPAATVTTETTDQTTQTETKTPDVNQYASDTAKKIVSAVNGDNKTVSDLVSSGALPATVTVGENTVNLSEYSFVTEFEDLVLKDGTNFTDDNKQWTKQDVEITIEGISDASNLSDYLIMVIDPVTGEKYFIPLDASYVVNAQAGTFKVPFPCLGPFCVLQKGLA